MDYSIPIPELKSGDTPPPKKKVFVNPYLAGWINDLACDSGLKLYQP